MASLFLKKIQEGLTVAIYHLGRGGRSASLLFDKNFGFKKRAQIVGALIRYSHVYRFDAFISS
jgi:hypothetical protein